MIQHRTTYITASAGNHGLSVAAGAAAFGARAVIAPRHHSAPETGALAKSASGALERQPYPKVRNLGDAMQALARMGYALIGLDGEAETDLGSSLATAKGAPVALVLGAVGIGVAAAVVADVKILFHSSIKYFVENEPNAKHPVVLRKESLSEFLLGSIGGNDALGELEEGVACDVEPPSYDEIVKEKSKGLPSYGEALHL